MKVDEQFSEKKETGYQFYSKHWKLATNSLQRTETGHQFFSKE
jgi:hypothetical protein